MSGLRGQVFRVLAGSCVLLTPVIGCNPTYKWNPEDALPGSGDPGAKDPLKQSGCEWAGANYGPYIKRILVQTQPIQVNTEDKVRLDAAVLGLRNSYNTCYSVDSIVAVAENTNQYEKPWLDWQESSGLALSPVGSTTWSVLATVKATTSVSARPKPQVPEILMPEAVSDVAQLTAFPGANSADVLHTWFVPGTGTNVALLDGFIDGGCVNDSLVVFTNKADLGQWTGDCLGPNGLVGKAGELAFFSETGAAVHRKIEWTPGNESIGLRLEDDSSPPKFDPVPPISIPVKVWFAASAPPSDENWSFIKESIELADVLFTRNRTGLRVTLAGEDNTDVELDLGSPSDTCDGIEAVHFPGVDPTDAVHVFVTKQVDLTAGYSCRSPNGVILLGDGTSAVTFAHELGHTLSLRVFPKGHATSREDPRTGHVDKHPDLGDWNVMFSSVSDDASQLRTQITLGQAFRMNFDTRSWLTATGAFQMVNKSELRRSLECQNTADEGECPRLDLDLAVLHPVVPEQSDQ